MNRNYNNEVDDHSNEHYVHGIDNVGSDRRYKTYLKLLRLNEHLRDDDDDYYELKDEEKIEEHLFVEIEMLDVQENFLVYLYFRMLRNNKMMMIELEHRYHVKMELLYERIRLVMDEERQVLVILFASR